MKKCKFYSEYDSGQHDFGVCHYDEYKSKGFPMICTHKDNEDNCTCFEPCEEGVVTAQLITDKDNPIDKIILKPKSLEIEVKIEKDNFDDFDFIEINGHKFKKV